MQLDLTTYSLASLEQRTGFPSVGEPVTRRPQPADKLHLGHGVSSRQNGLPTVAESNASRSTVAARKQPPGDQQVLQGMRSLGLDLGQSVIDKAAASYKGMSPMERFLAEPDVTVMKLHSKR